jgi:hypothetical protein
MLRLRFSAFLLLSACFAGAYADDAPSEAERWISFVTCPLVRDTEPTPCWLAEYEGELYYLGLQQDTEADFFPPQQGHQALIEGVVTNKPRICGGIPLEPVKASTMPEIDRSCNKILPAEGWVAPPARRGALPRIEPSGMLATDFDKPRPRRAPTPPPEPPFTVTTFSIPVDFGSEFMVNKATRAIQRAQWYALGTKATKIEIIGYRAGALLSNGKRLFEDRRLPKLRALKVAEALRDIGVGDAEIVVRWVTRGEKVTGKADYLLRRVDIIVTPAEPTT